MVQVTCKDCGANFEAQRRDAQRCAQCKIIRIREIGRLSARRTKYNSCPKCGGSKFYTRKLCRSCENKRRAEFQTGPGNPAWKGGKTHNNGYVYVLADRPDKKHRYQAEHIVVWEKANGELPEGWVIHHLNGVRDDNRLENLAAMPRKHHSPRLVVEPYQQRIQQLEAELSILAPTNNPVSLCRE